MSEQNFRVDTWTPDGESIVEHIAGVEDYQVALATYRAACERWPGTPITLRQGARVIEDSQAPARGVIGRVLINAQIAAGYALTMRLRCGDVFLRCGYGCPKTHHSSRL